MRIKAFRKNEEGAVAVIMAISLSVLFGFAALAVDYGQLASTKQALQTAADASALAAVADLGTGKNGNPVTTAKTYSAGNGFDPDAEGVTIDVQTVGNTVTVTLTKEVKMGFSSTFTGNHERSVSATATAEVTSIFGGCPYAMFAGRRIEDSGNGIEITGNNIFINGNIHSNSDINMKNAVLGPGAVATAVRSVQPSSSGWSGNCIALDMPSFSSFESALNKMEPLVEFFGDYTTSDKNGFQKLIDSALDAYEVMTGDHTRNPRNGLNIHIAGNLRFNGNSSTAYTAAFPITLIVDGDIDLNGATLNSSRDYPISLMSKNGTITVNGGGAEFTGIVYAPKGDVVLNGNNANFVGRIVAQDIRKAGGKITVTYYEDSDKFLPLTKVHLIN